MNLKSIKLAAVAAVLLAFCLVFMMPVGAYSGSGTADNPYEISSVADLKQLASDVNADTDAKTYENTYFKLTADLDLNNEGWTPIGNGGRSDAQHTGNSFSGTFDGAGHTISNLKITSGDSSDAVGLFGVLNGGTVKNLVLSNVQITLSSCKNAGAAIGLMVNGATAENIYVSSGSVSAADGAGGIVGRMTISGTIKDCINSATVSAAGGGAGGIVGKAYYTATGKVMTIQNCINTGDVTSTYAAGGIVGLSAANVNGCMNTGTISAGVEAGGIIGEQCQYGVISGNSNSGTISNTDVTGKGDNANGEVSGSTGTTYGGIIGWIRYNYGLTSSEYPLTAPISVTDNTNSGSIEATGCSLGAGGIVGSIYNNASVTGNINLATSVKGGVFAAGIVGNAQTNSDNAYYDTLGITVENNYVGTIEEQITVSNGICKNLFCYNNNADHFNVQSENIQLTAQTLTASTTAGGSMGISPSSPNKGQIVTITVTPYNNYEFGSLTVEGATPVKVGDKYLFMMPDNAVTVTPTFTEKTVVAKIGGTSYTSLQTAINEAADGAEIVLVANFALTSQNAQELFKPAYNRESYCGIYIPDDKKLTIDLAGHVVSYYDEYYDVDNVMVLNFGDLTIEDSEGGGKLSYTPVAGSSTYSKFYSTIFNCGSLTVNGGTIENLAAAETDVTNAVDCHSRLSHEYGNDCILTVNDGTLTGAYYYAVRQYTHYFSGVKNRVIINGGTIAGGIYMQHGDSWYYADASANRLNVDCVLTINGGTIDINNTPDKFGKIKSRLNNPDNNAWGIEINGGTINVPVELLVQKGVYYTNGVSGATTPAETAGTRTAEWLAAHGGFIKGGTFTTIGDEDDVTTNLKSFLAEGHICIQETDHFVVQEKSETTVVPDVPVESNTVTDSDTGETTATLIPSEGTDVTESTNENNEVVVTITPTTDDSSAVTITITGDGVEKGDDNKVTVPESASITATYKEAEAETDEDTTSTEPQVTFKLSVDIKDITQALPVIDAKMIDEEKKEAVKENSGKEIKTFLASFTALGDNDENGVNGNLKNDNGKHAVTFVVKVHKSLVSNPHLMAALHIDGEGKPKTGSNPTLTWKEEGEFYVVTITGPNFSSYVLVEEEPTSAESGSSSGSSSGKDTGSGNYQYYPRDVPTNGIVDFGTSKVVTGMELPEGSFGKVTLNTKPTFAMPENGYYAFEIDAPGYNLEAKINGGLSFQIPVADLEAAGWTAKDIVLYHGTVAEDGTINWEALPTNLVKNEAGIAYYKAAINGCSPFYIGFVKDGSVVNTEVVDPVTPPTETPDVPGTDLPEIPDVQDEPEEPSSPAPLAAVIAALGAAVVLRRK